MSKKVIVLGGGVAGMSAAHELAERGFEVHVYEKQPVYVGGKARSVDVPNSATDGREPLPGEHGFRFFPGFYKHVTDTMKRIPFGKNSNCFENLVPTQRVMMARYDQPPIVTLVNFPKSLKDLKVLIHSMETAHLGLTKEDKEAFAEKIWQLMCSSYTRRNQVYEKMGWWEYMDADDHSEAYREYFVTGLTRTLVAAQAQLVSTKTGGDILLQLFFLMANPSAHADRVLNAPTNDAWLYPWRDYLEKIGVNYNHGYLVESIECDGKVITGAKVKDEKTGQVREITGDYYISCVPVERMSGLLTDNILKADPTLASLKELAGDVQWMTGIQFYLNQDVKLTKGHVIFTSSQWALTAISQIQFWDGYKITNHGNGEVKGVLSIDVSDWNTPGIVEHDGKFKTAKQCTKEEIKEDVWAQLKKSLVDKDGNCLISDDMIIDYYLDRDIKFGDDGIVTKNEEPLLVNRVNTWALRPEAFTHIPNFLLASDYVRTNTDLATMEGANEAARRAVNTIIQDSGSDMAFCKIWKLHEPDVLAVFRWVDKQRFNKGLPFSFKMPWHFALIHNIWVLILKILGKL